MKFNISSNDLCAAGGKGLAEALSGNEIMTELNIASNHLGKKTWCGDADMSGVVAISDAIPTMGALTSLNLASNLIAAEGAKHVAEAIKGHVSALLFD